jgi:L-lactate dehydrogenase complex protein LldF
MLLVERDQATRAGMMPWWLRFGLRVFSFTVTRPPLYRLATTVSGWGSRFLAWRTKGWIRRLPPPLDGWTRSRDFPAFAKKSFRQQFRESRRADMLHLSEEPER